MSTADEVLLDAIMARHGYTRAEAEEAAKLVEKLWAARWLLESAQIAHEAGAEDATCRGCGVVDGLRHHPDCMAMAAWEALDLPAGHAAVGQMFDVGLRASPFRVVRPPGYVRVPREPQIRGHMHAPDMSPEQIDSIIYAPPRRLERVATLDDREAADTDAPVSPPGHETSHPPR